MSYSNHIKQNGLKQTQLKYYTKCRTSNPYVYIGLLPEVKEDVKITYNPKVDVIKRLLPKYYGLTFSQINVKSRKTEIVDVRHHLSFLVKIICKDMSLKSIGAIYRIPKDHSTIINSIKIMNNYIDTEPSIRQKHNEFLAEVKSLIV